MRAPGFALAALVSTASTVAAQPVPSAEEIILHLVNESSSEKRDAWYNANIQGKPVVWVAPVFNVTTAFGLTIVNTRPVDRGLIACNLPKRFEAAGKKVNKGDTVLCAGRIDNYERMMGTALINVEADNFVAGKDNIDAWEKAQKKSKP